MLTNDRKKTRTDDEMRELLRYSVMRMNGGQSAWAYAASVNQRYVSQILAGDQNITRKIAEHLGYERVWRKIKKQPA